MPVVCRAGVLQAGSMSYRREVVQAKHSTYLKYIPILAKNHHRSQPFWQSIISAPMQSHLRPKTMFVYLKAGQKSFSRDVPFFTLALATRLQI
jgi:hypothetical protein